MLAILSAASLKWLITTSILAKAIGENAMCIILVAT